MKILISWLREFVDVRLPATELASLLSRRGFEVASIEPVTGTADTRPHRDGVAEPEGSGGAGLPPSQCVGGLAGASGAGGRPCDDAVIDFEITANRPDCLSVIGIAREAATACRLPLALPWDAGGLPISRARPVPPPTAARVAVGGLDVAIEDAALCPRYAAAIVEVKVGPSPAWLANRLTASGVRPINNVVDVTNAVLIELGHPLHAFDLERLSGRQIRARPARAGERLRTLDGEDRALEAGMLVIADADGPQAVAGVMGGAASEVWSGTRLIALESAYFQPASVRRTSKRLGLKTEASSRFERGADINAPVGALERACALLEQTGAGRRVGAPLDCYPAPRGPAVVTLRRHRIARLIGKPVDDAEVEEIFGGLGFDVEPTADGWSVRVPTMRVDIGREADLIEEIARHHGYEQVPTTFPALRAMSPRPEPRIARKGLLRHVLAAAGFSEAISYSFIEAAAARPFTATGSHEAGAAASAPLASPEACATTAVPADDLVALAYPLSEKFAVLRPSLLPGLVDAVAHNRRRENRDVRLFEIGSSFSLTTGERQRAAFAWTGAGTPEHWGGGMRPVDFSDARGVVERIGEALGLPFVFAETTRTYLAPGRAATVSVGQVAVGVIGQVATALAEARDLPGSDDIYVAELDLDALEPLVGTEDVRATPLPRFPSIVRDISIVIDEGLRSERIRASIRLAAPATLVQVREFDRYKGKGIPEGRYSLSIRLTFRSPERTLTDAEVQQAMERIIPALIQEHRAVQR